AGQDDFRVIANGLGLVRQIVRINANAMSAHQARAEWQEVPLGSCRFEYRLSIDAQTIEYKGKFVNECDIDVALGIFDDLGSLSHPDGRRLMRACGNDLTIKLVDQFGHFRGGTRRHLLDGGHAVQLVAWIDTLGAV